MRKSQTAPESGETLRQKVARIINPEAWANRGAWASERVRESYLSRRDNSLAKADEAIAEVRAALRQPSALEQALRQWKCPSCGGSRTYLNRTKGGEERISCKVCTDGLHPIASAALTGQPSALDSGDGGEVGAAIEALRADEGDSVTICCDDPEAVDASRRMAIDCVGAWTDWRERRFYGPSVAACLAAAVEARQQAGEHSHDYQLHPGSGLRVCADPACSQVERTRAALATPSPTPAGEDPA